MYANYRGGIFHTVGIELTDGEIIENADIYFLNGFLIVSTDNEDAPTWYNVNEIKRIKGVKLQDHSSESMRLSFL